MTTNEARTLNRGEMVAADIMVDTCRGGSMLKTIRGKVAAVESIGEGLSCVVFVFVVETGEVHRAAPFNVTRAPIDPDMAETIAAQKTTTHRGFSVYDLSVAFDAISPLDNWKGELAGMIPVAALEKARAAAEFFAGSKLDVVYMEPEMPGRVRQCVVKGPGYYACIGA